MAAADTKIGIDCAALAFDGVPALDLFENVNISRTIARKENWELEVTVFLCSDNDDVWAALWPTWVNTDPKTFTLQPYTASGTITADFIMQTDGLAITNEPQKLTYRFALADETPTWGI